VTDYRPRPAPVTYPAEFDVLSRMEDIADRKLDGTDYHVIKSAMLEIIELRILVRDQTEHTT
jgi:hypothetical protein